MNPQQHTQHTLERKTVDLWGVAQSDPPRAWSRGIRDGGLDQWDQYRGEAARARRRAKKDWRKIKDAHGVSFKEYLRGLT